MSVGSRIKELRENKELSRNELAKMLGVTVGAISNYENDVSSPKEPILFRIIEILGCDANYLFQDVVNIPKKINNVTLSEFERIKKYRALDEHGKKMVDFTLDEESKRVESKKVSSFVPQNNCKLIQYYGRLASAGTGQIVFDGMPTKLVEIPDIAKYHSVNYAIEVNGDSMEPLYQDGDILLVENMDSIEIGDIGIFLVDGESYVKKLGNNELISLNHKRHNIPISPYTICMGKVIGKLEIYSEADKAAIESARNLAQDLLNGSHSDVM